MNSQDLAKLKEINQNIAFFEKRLDELLSGEKGAVPPDEIKKVRQSLLANLLLKNRLILSTKTENQVMKDISLEYKKVLKQIEGTLKNLYIELQAVKDEARVKFYKRLIDKEKKIKKMVEENLKNVEKIGIDKLDTALRDVFSGQINVLGDSLEKMYGITGTFDVIRPEMMRMIIYFPFHGKVWSERWGDITRKTVDEIREIFVRGLIRGDSVDDMTRLVHSTFIGNGLKSPISRARTLVRTEIHRIMTEANNYVYEQIRTNIKGWLYMATLDDATCVVCGGYDGMYFAGYDAPKPYVPQHPNCRCEYLPVFYGQDPYNYARGYRDLKTGSWLVKGHYFSYRAYLKSNLDSVKNAREFRGKYPKLASHFNEKALEMYYKTGDIHSLFKDLKIPVPQIDRK